MIVTIPYSRVVGTVFYLQSMEEFATSLAEGGFAVTIGQWSLRLDDWSRVFKLRYVGNITPEAPFEVDGDCYGVAVDHVVGYCERLAHFLRNRGIAYDFDHFVDGEKLVGEYKSAL